MRVYCILWLSIAWAGSSAAQTPDLQEIERLNTFFEQSFEAQLDRNPIQQTFLGIKKDYGEWPEITDAEATTLLAMTVDDLARLRSEFDFNKLDAQARLSYRLFEYEAEQAIASFPWRHHHYELHQMRGLHSFAPSFLINYHRIDTAEDAAAYIRRLEGFTTLFDQLVRRMRDQHAAGISVPSFVFPLVLDDCHNVLAGAPFDDSEEPSALWRDFGDKLDGLTSLDEQDKEALLDQASAALVQSVRPAYAKLIAVLEEMGAEATENAGVWNLPRGAEYYDHQLRQMTTTQLSAEKIHEIGLAEVARIHGEMQAIMQEVEFEGSLQEFFQFLREDDRFYYANTDEGRRQYLQDATAVIDRMRADLQRMFLTRPKAEMIVKRVEAFREKSAGTAFYGPGAPDGSRPGIYYANLHDMRRMPKYQMESLAFHEGIPGHHMQLSIAQELEGLPRFRRFSLGYTAYAEGWALYCELMPKEFGYYEDPYSNFGRLAAEVWRAARLVVDTGLHHHRWSRQQAIDYLIENTPDAEDECVRAINRYLVMPAQATAYKIGMLKILELRTLARQQLGEAFDIREFHDVLLANGALPLDMLEEQVKQWLAEQEG